MRQEGNASAVDARPEKLEHRRQDGDGARDGAGDDGDRAAAATPLKTSEPIKNWPAIAITTVVPAMITVCPEVRAVRSSASCEDSPRSRSSRERMT